MDVLIFWIKFSFLLIFLSSVFFFLRKKILKKPDTLTLKEFSALNLIIPAFIVLMAMIIVLAYNFFIFNFFKRYGSDFSFINYLLYMGVLLLTVVIILGKFNLNKVYHAEKVIGFSILLQIIFSIVLFYTIFGMLLSDL